MLRDKIRERFILMIDYILVDHKMTTSDLCKILNISESMVSALRSGLNKSVKSEYVAQVCIKFKYNPTWVLTGKGDMRDSSLEKSIREDIREIKTMLGK